MRLLLLWIFSVLMIMLPGLSYFLWQVDVLDRDFFFRHEGFPMLSYAVGNVGALVFIVSAIWKATRADSMNKKSPLPIAGVITIIAFDIAGFIGMGNYIGEFVAG